MLGGVFRVEAAEEVAIECENTFSGCGWGELYRALSNWSASDIVGLMVVGFEVGISYEAAWRGCCSRSTSEAAAS